MIDPMNSVNWNKPLVGVNPQGDITKVMINNMTGTPTMWVWSVLRRQGGYRTYGLSVSEMVNVRGWNFYIDSDSEDFE